MSRRAAALLAVTAVVGGTVLGLVASRLTSWNPFVLTAHQLEVLRTLGSIGGGLGGLGGGLAAVFSFLARYWSRQAARNTATSQWVDGKLKTLPVAETARHAALTGEATRQEVSDLGGWIRGSGRRRQPTGTVPSIYAGDDQ